MKNTLRNSQRVPRLFALLLGSFIMSQVWGQTLVQYDASALPNAANTNIPVFSNNSNVTATTVTRGAGLSAAVSSGSLSSTGWPVAATAPAGSDYYTFTINANSGFVLDVRGTVLSFGTQRTTNAGVTKVYVYTSADGFTAPLSTTTLNTTNVFNVTCTLPNTGVYNNLFNLEVRIYGDAATNGAIPLLLRDPSAGPTNIQLSGGAVVNCIPQLTFISSQPPICDGDDINLTATFTSPITPTYSWVGPSAFSSGIQSPSISGATGANGGTYTVTATSAGCGSANATTTYNVSDIQSTINSTLETCPGTCDGASIVNPGGGIGQYTFSWSPSGGTSASATGLCSGHYTVTITDGIGCTATNSTAISANDCSNSTQLNSVWCEATNCNLSQTIACVAVPGATNYEYRFTNNALGYSYSRVKGNGMNSIPLSWILGLQYGYTYQVQVRPYVNNMWQNYGPVCNLSMAATVPNTQLNGTSCGATNHTLSSALYVVPVGGAANYEYRISNGTQPYNYTRQRGASTTSIPLSWFPGLQYGQTYDVEVRALVGGDWGTFGPVCTFSMQANPPSPTVTTCGGPFALTQPLYCTAVVGAQDYEWKFVGAQTYTRTRGNNSTSFYVSSIAGFVPGTYMVSVRAKVGGVWSNVYGSECSVTFSSPARMQNPEATNPDATTIETVPMSLLIYPNPVGQGITPTINLQGADGQVATITVVDLSGRLVTSYQVTVAGNDFNTPLVNCEGIPSGMYFMTVIIGEEALNSRFIQD